MQHRPTFAGFAVFRVALLLAVLIPGLAPETPAGPVPSGYLISVSNPAGEPVPQNLFSAKLPVYLRAVPAEIRPVEALPDGDYIFQVTNPDGSLQLSSDRALCRIFRVQAGGIAVLRDPTETGLIDHLPGTDYCHTDDQPAGAPGASGHHDSNSLTDGSGIAIQLMPFADTTHPDGDYRVNVLPLKIYLDNGGWIFRLPKPLEEGYVPDPGFKRAKQVLHDEFRIGSDSGVNRPPVADAGPDQSFLLGETVFLDGSGSTDIDGDALTYRWNLTGPSGSNVSLVDENSAAPSFTPDLRGDYTAMLIVNDGDLDSQPDSVLIRTANSPPVADAGPDRVAQIDELVELDGSGSSDVDGDFLTFAWSLVSPSDGSGASLTDSQSAAPSFSAEEDGIYVLQLIVSDGMFDSPPDTVSVTVAAPDNLAPVADAGPDQTFVTGQTVTLDGSGSSDLDGDPLTFAWSLSSPSGSLAELDDPTRVMPTFAPDIPGTYTATLIVNDGQIDSAPDQVAIRSGNSPPVADAGPDRTANVLELTTLDGSGSTDVDGDPLTYSWSFVQSLDPELFQILQPNAVMPEVFVGEFGSWDIRLIVNDGEFDSAPDFVTIATENRPPIANAGPDQSVTVGSSVNLDGGASFDPDGSPITFSWSLTAPAGSSAALSDPISPFPTFVPDLAGDYLAQLIVDDGELMSTPDTMMVTTLNTAPIADAGADQTILPGVEVTLDGSGSSDAEGDPLNFAWSLSSVPAGSLAMLSDTTAVMPTFVPDFPGTYVAQLIVDDGVLGSAPDTAVLSTENVAPVAEAGPDQSLFAGSVVFLDGSGSTDSDGDPLNFRWSFADRPQNSTAEFSDSTAAMPTFFADFPGLYLAQLIVDDGELESTPDTVSIQADGFEALRLTLESTFIGLDRTVNGTVFSLNPVPAGGLPVTLTSDDVGIAAIAPLTVTIPAGQLGAPVTVEGITLGETTLRAESPGYIPAAEDVTVTDFLVSVAETLEIAPGETAGLPVSLSSPAPNGGQEIFFTSTDPQIATVTPSVFVSEGSQTPQANPQIVGGAIGTVTILASSPGYAPDSAEVTVTIEMAFYPDSLSLALETVEFPLTFLSPTPPQGLELSLSIDDPSIASVPSTLIADGGVLNFQIPVSGLTDGETFLRVNSPGIAEAVARVSVYSAIDLDPVAIGKGLQRSVAARLAVVAPPEGRDIVVTSADPSRLLVSASADEPGGASVTLNVPGNSASLAVWMQALDNSGTVDLIATAEAHRPTTTAMSLRPSGFAFVPGSVQTTTQDVDVPVGLAAYMLDPTSSNPVQIQRLRPGTDATVGVTSSDTNVATLDDVPVEFAGGDSSISLRLQPQGGGTTALDMVQPAGFSLAAQRQSIDAVVTTPPLNFATVGHRRVGFQLLERQNVGFAVIAQQPTTITLTVADPSILILGPDTTSPGTSTLVLPPTTTSGSFFLHGLTMGTTTITAEAEGYQTTTATFDVVASGFRLRGINFQQSLSTFDPNRVVEVVTEADVFTNPRTRLVRPGFSAEVAVENSDPSVAAVLGAPVQIDGPSTVAEFEVDPITSGQTVISLVQPPGFTLVGGIGQTTVTVDAPVIYLASSSAVSDPIRMGRDTQRTFSASLGAVPPTAVDLTVSVADPSMATLTMDLDADSSAGTIVFPSVVTNTSNFLFGIQAKGFGSTQLTISAPGFQTRTYGLEITPAGFHLYYNTNIPINTFDSNRSISIDPVGLDPTTLVRYGYQELRAGLSVPVEVLSSVTSVAAVTSSPVLVGSGTGNWTTGLDPLTAGTTVLSVVTPPGFSTENAPPVSVTVTAPTISFGVVPPVGLDMQWGLTVILSERPPNPIDVTVFSTAPDLVAVSPGSTIVGGNSITFTNVTQNAAGVVFVQGIDLGSAQITAQAPGYADENRTIHVWPSGFVVQSPIDYNFYGGVGTSRTIGVEPVVLNPSNLVVIDDRAQIRAGVSVELAMTSGDESIVTVSPPVTGVGGDSQLVFVVDAVGSGTTTLTVEVPPGFSQPATERVVNAIVP